MKASLNVRLSGLDGSHIAWCLNDPADSDGWESSRITTVTALLPHIRQYFRVRQALVRAPGGGHHRDRLAREPSDRHPPPGPARADPGGE